MTKRRAVLAIVAALLIGIWLGWIAAKVAPAPTRPGDPIASARSYVVSHHPELFKRDGEALSYHVEDHGEVWTVEVSPQAQIGGGLRLIVRRRDGQVTLVGKT